MHPRHRAAIIACLAALYVAVMLVGTHMPLRGVPSPGVGNDKIVHVGMYTALAVLILAVVSATRPVTLLAAALVALLIAAYGALDEWSQQFVPSRSSDLRDWLADALGAVAGSIIFLVLQGIWRSRTVAAI